MTVPAVGFSGPTYVQLPGNGSATTFSFPFLITAASDLVVGLITAGVYTLQSGYAVSGVGNSGGGQVTFPTAPPTGTTVDLRSLIPETQPTNFANLGAYLPENTTNAVDRVTRNISDLYRLTYIFGVHGPDQEVTPWPALPGAAARANTALIFDGNGLPGIGVLTSTLFNQATWDGFYGTSTAPPFGITPAEIVAGVTPVTTKYLPGDVRRYGGTLDGVTDCCAALVTAARVGGAITAPGNMALASSSLAALPNKAIALGSNTSIQGSTGYTCTITGSTPCNVFWSVNPSNISITNFACTGNGSSSATSGTGYFWYLQGTAAATGELGNISFDRNTLTNFAGLYWVYVDQTLATAFSFVRFRGERNTCISQPGNCQTAGLTTITTTASVFGFSGSNTVTSFYSIKDVVLRENVANGTFIKQFVFFWSGTLRCKAHDNTLIGFGTDASISDDTGCYALAAYDFSHGTGLAPNEIEFYDNTIDVVRDCGVYSANANQLTVQNNRVQGQTCLVTALLPKGAIVLNGVDVTCTGNTILSSAIGISAVQFPGALRCDILDNAVSNLLANGIGLWISGTTGGNAPSINVDGISIASAASGTRGIHIIATSTVAINDLNIQNFDITGTANGIDLLSPDSSVPAMGNVRIGRGRLRRITGNNLQWLNATNATFTRATFENIDFMDMQAGAVGFFIVNAVNVTVRNLTFYDLTSGATGCWYASGAQGRVQGVQYVNVAVANRFITGGSDLAISAPGWTGNDNDFVQDLNITEQGIATSKYVRVGWTWDRVAAAWKECRALTGN